MKNFLSLLMAFALVAMLMPASLAESATYAEAPVLAARVEAGELPPVDERLPEDPMVITVAEEIGEYGGTWRQAVAIGAKGHALGHMGFPIGFSMIMYGQDNSTIIPNLASSYEVNADYTEFTFTMRRGMKWSDGVEVTMADVQFWWEDILHNAEINPSIIEWEGVEIEYIDDYTFKLIYPESRPLQLARFAYASNSRFIYPAHYLKQFHAGYLTEDELAARMEELNFSDWVSMFGDRNDYQVNMELPTLAPFVMTSDPAETNTLTFVRNPYYWAVDEEGQQLPYIDECVLQIVESTDLMNMKIVAGEVDIQMAGVMESFSNYPLFAQYAEEMGYHIETNEFDEPNAMNIHFNATSVDPVKAPYLSSVDFRRALSLGMDRDTLIATFYTVGPYVSAKAQTSPIEASPYYSEEMSTQYTDYDVDAANALLDGLGMTEMDSDGYRMTANGEEFSLVILCPNYDAQWIEIMEMVASQWRENLKLNITATQVDPGLWDARVRANDFDITNCTGHSGFSYLSTTSLDCWTGYQGTQWNRFFMAGAYLWNTDSENAEFAFEPTGEILRMWEIGNLVTTETDVETRDALIAESLKIQTDNLYVLGIARRLPGIIIVKDNVRNAVGLNQDWAYGFCATSRPETYWFDAE